MPCEPPEIIVIENRLSEMSRVEQWLAGVLETWGLSPQSAFAVDLVINEAVTNVISYGYKDGATHQVSISLTSCDDRVLVEVLDDGIAFDPFRGPAMSAADNLEDASIGGRGIFLIKSFSETYDYKRVADRNRMRLSIRKEAGGQPQGG